MTIPDGARVLDIGAGPGPFALPLAERGCDVTVVEPSPVMREALAGGMDERGISNVRVIPKRWEDVTVADLGHGSHEQHGTYHHPPEMAGHQCREEREGVAEPRVKYWRG